MERPGAAGATGPRAISSIIPNKSSDMGSCISYEAGGLGATLLDGVLARGAAGRSGAWRTGGPARWADCSPNSMLHIYHFALLA